MRIANPLYDHAFKYLMSNEKLAKKVLSTILEQSVIHLELSQQEIVVANEEKKFTLYRLDFKAIIVNDNGKREEVMIELQKSKLPTNLLRFRNYLGYSYVQKTKEISSDKAAEEKLLPIISIYILGYNLADLPVMAAKVDRKITDTATNQELDIESDFIELLTHKCYVLQVRRLPPKRQSRIEKFMTLFNQAWISEEKYILNLEEVPEEFKDIAEYLQKPLNDKVAINQLAAEAEVEMMFAIQEAQIEKAMQATQDERRQKEVALQQKEDALQQKEDALQQKEDALQQKQEALYKLAKMMKKNNVSIADIIKETGLSRMIIEQL